MKSVLIYGDSLVYGKLPNVPTRYAREKRFIGVAEKELGNEYRIIDEGLRARLLSGENGFFPERNGLDQFGPIFASHLPLDLVCLFLGTNDCNKKDTKTSDEIKESLYAYLEKINSWIESMSIDHKPLLMIIAPPIVRGDQVMMSESIQTIFNEQSEEKTLKLVDIYKSFCDETGSIFFNASDYSKTADGEGVHLDEENNRLLGLALAEKIKIVLTN